MRLFIAAALPIAALAACSGGEANNNMASEAGATGQELPPEELPTTELNMESDPNAVGPADNQVDQQSAFDEAVGDAGSTASNSVE